MIRKVEKVWGSEEWIVNNEQYCGKILILNKGYTGSLHFHKNKHETFYVLEGRVLLEIGDKKLVLNVGDSHIIEPGQKHRFTPLENSKMIEFSTHHDDADTYRSTQSEAIDLSALSDAMKGVLVTHGNQ